MNNICDFMTKEELDNALIERDFLITDRGVITFKFDN